MITPRNQLTVPEVMAYSRQEIEGGIIIRYLMRQPGETAWQPVKVFRPCEQETMSHEGRRRAPHEKTTASTPHLYLAIERTEIEQ